MMGRRFYESAAVLMLFVTVATACGDDGIILGSTLGLEFDNLTALDPETEGSFEAWVIDGSGVPHSAGKFVLPPEGHVVLENPTDDPKSVLVTVEPPGDSDPAPSGVEILGGAFHGQDADLSIDGHVTAGPALRENIGSHALFTPANNSWKGYPSIEDAGIWIFNLHVIGDPMQRQGLDLTSEFFLKVTPLKEEWTYEGWVVLDYGLPGECWVSYGKMDSGLDDRLNRQDNTGFGPFSGYRDYVANPVAIEHNFPGDDWVENPLGLTVPCGLEVPFDLNGNRQQGISSRWTHVITIEPASDRATENPELDMSAPLWAKPFVIRPYMNAIGEGFADEARVIGYHAAGVPGGTAQLWGT